MSYCEEALFHNEEAVIDFLQDTKKEESLVANGVHRAVLPRPSPTTAYLLTYNSPVHPRKLYAVCVLPEVQRTRTVHRPTYAIRDPLSL